MNAVGKIKLAPADLGLEEQYELFRWWTGSDSFRQRRLAALKGDIASGMADLNNGRYQTYDDTNVMRLPEEASSDDGSIEIEKLLDGGRDLYLLPE